MSKVIVDICVSKWCALLSSCEGGCSPGILRRRRISSRGSIGRHHSAPVHSMGAERERLELERYFAGGLLAGICGVCGWVPRPCSLPVDATEAIATAGGSSGRVNRF